MEKLGYLQQSNHSELNRKEILELARRSREGDPCAREQLFFSHLDQVAYFVNRFKTPGVDSDDLYQDACFGLIMAIDRFDPERGVLLKTYAAYWIKKMLNNTVLHQNTHIPMDPKEDIIYDLRKYHQIMEDYQLKHGRALTDNELAEKMHRSPANIRKLRSYHYRFSSLDVECIPELSDCIDKTAAYARIPACKASPSAEHEFLKTLHELEQPACSPMLTKREEEVLCRRIGVTETGEPETFAAISQTTGWSAETVRTDYHHAIYKLRKCTRDLFKVK